MCRSEAAEIWTQFVPLSSTTETGLQSIATHFARELVGRSQVDSLSLHLNAWWSVA